MEGRGAGATFTLDLSVGQHTGRHFDDPGKQQWGGTSLACPRRCILFCTFAKPSCVPLALHPSTSFRLPSSPLPSLSS